MVPTQRRAGRRSWTGWCSPAVSEPEPQQGADSRRWFWARPGRKSRDAAALRQHPVPKEDSSHFPELRVDRSARYRGNAPPRDMQMFTLSRSRLRLDLVRNGRPNGPFVQSGTPCGRREGAHEERRHGGLRGPLGPIKEAFVAPDGKLGCPDCLERPAAPSTCECGAAGVRKRPSEGPIGGLGRTAEFVHRKDSTSAPVCN